MIERIAVIGAGLAGLVVAARLHAAGRTVTVFDKSRGLGGRHATRRTDFGAFDHGAPVAHCERAPIQFLETESACVRWGDLGHVGLPGMSGFVGPLARGLDIRTTVEIATVRVDGAHVVVKDAAGDSQGSFERAVLAIPAMQARRVSGDLSGAEALDHVVMKPVWTLMAAFGRRPDLPDVVRPGGALKIVVRNGAKPGRSGETWVAHASSDWTRDRLEQPHEAVLPKLLAEFSDIALGRLPRPVHVEAHRWRYGLADRPLGVPFLRLAGGRVLAGGDWALGSRAEHAWLSGQGMADEILG